MDRFRLLFNRIESILLKICFISILLLIGLQIFINGSEFAVFLQSDRGMDRIPLEGSRNKGIIILEVDGKDDSKYLEVLVNGEVVKRFNNNEEVTIEVYNNDLIEINGAKCRESVRVRVTGVSKNISLPKLNTTVKVAQSIEILSKVVIK